MTALHIRFGASTPLPLDVLLSSLPGMPKPVLAHLVDRAIDQLNERDDGSDLEDSEAGETAIDERGRQLQDMSWWQTEDDEDSHDQEDIDERESEDDT